MAKKTNTSEQLNKNGNRRGMNPNSRKNLDIHGNNHAKSLRITSALRTMIDEPADERWLEVEDKHKGFTWAEAIAKRMLIESTRGNAKQCSEVLDRLEGKVAQPVTGEGGKPIEVNIDYRDKILNAISRYAIAGSEGESGRKP